MSDPYAALRARADEYADKAAVAREDGDHGTARVYERVAAELDLLAPCVTGNDA